MLIEKMNGMRLSDLIKPAAEFLPFPKFENREKWESFDEEIKKLWIDTAESFLTYEWPGFTMDIYYNFLQDGDYGPCWDLFTKRRSVLGSFLFAELFEGKGRFLKQILNGVYALCEETSWVQPFYFARNKEKLPDEKDYIVDLSSSQTAELLAWIYYLLEMPLDGMSRSIRERIKNELEKRVIKPYVEKNDYWWMGFMPSRMNNWNPWCNMNMLMCYLLIDYGKEERERGIERIMRSLDRYIETYVEDGGCDEGPMYWSAAGAGLNTCLELLHSASGGVIDVFSEQKVKNIGTYIYKVYIHNNYYVDYADGDAIVPDCALTYNYGKNINDEYMTAMGARAKVGKPVINNWFMVYSYLIDIFYADERKNVDLATPYVRDAWLPVTEVMCAREFEGSEKGFFLSAKGGYNEESHNHNDIGNFIVYYNGNPVLIDLGTENYKAQTFSSSRFELWYLQSQYHNCPTINGVLQKDGREFKANGTTYTCTADIAALEMDIAESYPKEAGAKNWKRSCTLHRGNDGCVEITDAFTLEKPSEVTYNIMSIIEPRLESNGVILQGEGFCIKMSCNEGVYPEIEKIAIEDARLKRNWGNTVYRIVFKEKDLLSEGNRTLKITAI